MLAFDYSNLITDWVLSYGSLSANSSFVSGIQTQVSYVISLTAHSLIYKSNYEALGSISFKNT